ncbi:metalloregulator ArsR/SmtB family transcription factor [Vulcanimicrobium alpinum]|nr:metalloregulator ArsR/SmtB family transcription factor [Vulcanimicrobium alpinum]
MARAAEARRKRQFKDAVYAAAARVPAALANRHRLELLDLLSQRPRAVADVAAEAGITIANASQHLQVLARCGLVAVERRGTYAFYRAAGPPVFRLLAEIRAIASSIDARVADAERAYLGSREPCIPTYGEACGALDDPRTILLDARPREEYEAAHLPGAISAPLDALRSGTIGLTRSRRYVVYCRGPYCVFADDAVLLLRERGFDATRLALGPAEWVAAGGEVQRAG